MSGLRGTGKGRHAVTATRPIWKGEIRFGDVAIPVKLHSAVTDHGVHFRLLHKSDHQPVKQVLVNPRTDAVVTAREAKKAYRTESDQWVLLSREELDECKPKKSRRIDAHRFLPSGSIDHRWYDRPYYLGPDGDPEDYWALVEALRSERREGLMHWVMRNKEYFGALKPHRGYLLLLSLRNTEQIIPAESLSPPKPRSLRDRELSMARELIGMLDDRFDAGEYRNEYREQLRDLIERKQRGGRIRRPAVARKKEPPAELTRALEASLKEVRHG